MFVLKRFPLALAVCFALTLAAATAASAQTEPARPRQVTQTVTPDGTARLETDVYLVSEAAAPASVEIARPALAPPISTTAAPRLFRLNHMLMTAIEDRLGAPYVLGTEGPYRFDCSGFVWGVFQSAGVHFERGTARHCWSQFQPVDGEDRYKFGTLVFFNNLGHVGIVADENGFYHASSSKGITYSPFKGYWQNRIVGFKRLNSERVAAK